MTKFFLIIFSLLIVSHKIYAHGEDKLGPHKGYIKMPGAFHTELVPFEKYKVKVYLLDIHWKNATVKKSKIQLTYNDKFQADCESEKNYFICSFDKAIDLNKKGELKVLAEREGQKGVEVIYSLPFKLEKINDSHSSHH